VPFCGTGFGSPKARFAATREAEVTPRKPAIPPTIAAFLVDCSLAVFASSRGRANRNLESGTIVVLVPRPFETCPFVLQSSSRGQFGGEAGGPILPDFWVIRRVALEQRSINKHPLQGNARGTGNRPAISRFIPSTAITLAVLSGGAELRAHTLPILPKLCATKGVVKSSALFSSRSSRAKGWSVDVRKNLRAKRGSGSFTITKRLVVASYTIIELQSGCVTDSGLTCWRVIYGI
jgi:hypothetical protein